METRTAVVNTFGSVPKNGNAKRPAAPAAPKLALTTESQAAKSPADPRVQAILDTRLPDGTSVKEKLDASTPEYILKAAQDHYNAQKDRKEAPDAVSSFYLNNAAREIARHGINEAKVTPERIAGVFNLEQINRNLEQISKDPAFIKWAGEQQANAVENAIAKDPEMARLVAPYLQEGENHVNALRRMQADYMRTQSFADGVAASSGGREMAADGMKTLSSFGLIEKEMLDVANTLAENIRAKYTPDAPYPVIDPNTNKPVQTDDGTSLARMPDGTYIALDKNGLPAADAQGHPWVYNEDGTAKLDANNAYLQYDTRARATFASYGGVKYLTGKDGKAQNDAQGRPLVIDSGAIAALGKDGKVVADAAGNTLVFNPLSGKAVADPKTGNAVVLDPKTGGIVQVDANGKIVTANNGDPYAADRDTGKFVTDTDGNYVLISRDNMAPGIVPGYVVDRNNSKVVVNPDNGRPMVDPALGKTVILDPVTKAPQLVPLDANGVPRQSSDGKGISYDESGNTVVPNTDLGPNWLVNADGNYVQNASGNYIGVDRQTGLAAPVDENGFVKNAAGLVPLWDVKAKGPMSARDGRTVAADADGNLLLSDDEGKAVVEEKTSLPYLFNPATGEAAVNPETGRSILLDRSGLPVEYNADHGYKYLINPETGTVVRNSDGHAVTTDDDGIPYAIRQDGSAVRNPQTGNFIVYGTDGQPAKEHDTGYPIEITSGGKAHVIDPKTGTPMAERDPKTGGYQVFGKDGNAVTDPDSGNPVQMVPDSGLKMEIDADTGKVRVDAGGNPLVLGADYRPLKTPDGKAVVGDLKTGLPVAADADGKLVRDPASGLPLAVDPDTGKLLADPDSGLAVVADPKSRELVQVDAAGKIVTDPVTGMPVAIDGRSGARIVGPDGALAVRDPRTGLPVYFDSKSKLFTVVDPATGKAAADAKTGAKTIVDYGSGLTFNVLRDAAGNGIIVDDKGLPVKDDKGTQSWFDAKTGKAVMTNARGEVVDVQTGKAPEATDPSALVYTTPLLMLGPPGIAVLVSGDTGAGVGDPSNWPQPTASSSNPRPWEVENYTMTPEERAAFVEKWRTEYGSNSWNSYDSFLNDVREIKARHPELAHIPDAELVAVRGYTGSSWWSEANKALYTGDPELLARREAYIKAVKSGLTHLEKAGFSYKGKSVRYMNLPMEKFVSMFGGSIYKNRQFMSTSTLKEGADLFSNLNTRLKINHLTGVPIDSISRIPDQMEVIGMPDRDYRISNFKPAGSRGSLRTLFKPTTVNKATLTELPPDKLLGGNPDMVPSDVSTPSLGWGKLGKVLNMAGVAADAVFGGVQLVTGGMEIADGVRNKDSYGIASGTLNVGSGLLSIGSTAAWLAGGAAAAATAPLAAAAAMAGMIALIVDILKHQNDHTNFANSLGEQFGGLGILNEDWHDKAAQAYYDGHSEPDPAPIAHGNLP